MTPPRRPSAPAGLRIRALVLAAGRGERLRPLTAAIPKPLLPVLGQPLVAHTLRALRRVGCEAAALNLHHLGGAVRERFGDRFGPLPLVWSEERELMGTLGAFAGVRDFLADADLVLVVNGDSLCRWPLRRLVHAHLAARRAHGAVATLLTARRADPGAFGGGIALARDGRVLALRRASAVEGAAARRVFAGAQALEPALVRRAPDRPSDLVAELYEPLLAEGATLASIATSRPWHDLGTPARYLAGVVEIAGGRGWAAKGVARHGRGRRAVLEAGVAIGSRARVERSLVLAGARVGDGARLRDAIVAPGVEIAAGSRIEGQLVTPAAWGLGARGSQLGELVYTPLAP